MKNFEAQIISTFQTENCLPKAVAVRLKVLSLIAEFDSKQKYNIGGDWRVVPGPTETITIEEYFLAIKNVLINQLSPAWPSSDSEI